MEYFSYLPDVTHSGEVIKNITLRAVLQDYLHGNPHVFLPYIIDGIMRPEDIALHYYGDMKYTWLVYLSNNIVDPYYDWVMSDFDLDKYIIKKYYGTALEWKHFKQYNPVPLIVGYDLPDSIIRPDATALVIGDLYKDLVSLKYYEWDGLQWIESITKDLLVIRGNTNPNITVRLDNSTLAINDLYNNVMTDDYFKWTGTVWELVTIADNEVMAFTQNATIKENIVEFRNYNNDELSISVDSYYTVPVFMSGVILSTTRPSNEPLSNGDVFYNTTTNLYYVWDSEIWSECNIEYFNRTMIQSEWYPIRYYDWEVEQNENRRHIVLVDKRYLYAIRDELKVKFNER